MVPYGFWAVALYGGWEHANPSLMLNDPSRNVNDPNDGVQMDPIIGPGMT